jgi:hypothetical protein
LSVSSRDLAERRRHQVDLVGSAEVVVSNPDTASPRNVANNTALLQTSRGRLVEYDAILQGDVIVAAVPRLLRAGSSPRKICRPGDGRKASAAVWRQPAAGSDADDQRAEVALILILGAEAR